MGIPLNINIQQILLHLLNFAILAGGLYFLLYGPVKSFMEKRTAYYKDLDEKANAALKEAQKAEEEYNARLLNMQAELNENRVKMFEDAQKNIDSQMKEAKEEAKKIIEKAKKAAEEERAKIVESAQKEVVKIAISATENVINKTSSDSLDEFLASVKEA